MSIKKHIKSILDFKQGLLLKTKETIRIDMENKKKAGGEDEE